MANEHELDLDAGTSSGQVADDQVAGENTDVVSGEDAGSTAAKKSGVLGRFFGRGAKKNDAESEPVEQAEGSEVDADTDAVLAVADTPSDGKRHSRRAKPKRKDERLSSVLTESEPGAAVDVMRQVEPFTVPGGIVPGGAWLMLVLPTADKEFGGLSKKQNKNEDKGMIVNLVRADEIKAVITPDLLEDDAMGLIPDAGTLERIDEFSVLREARYFWGVAVVDPDSAALMVFTIPPKREEDSDGRLFETAAAVSRGDLDITDVIDVSIVKAMWDIFSEDGEMYGANGALAAIDATIDLFAEAKAEGRHAGGVEIVRMLRDVFPKIHPDYVEGDDEDDDEGDTEVFTAVSEDGDDGEVTNYAQMAAAPAIPAVPSASASTDDGDAGADAGQETDTADTEQVSASEQTTEDGATDQDVAAEEQDGDDEGTATDEKTEAVVFGPEHGPKEEVTQEGFHRAASDQMVTQAEQAGMSPAQVDELLGEIRTMLSQQSEQGQQQGLRDDDVDKIIWRMIETGVAGQAQQQTQPVRHNPSEAGGDLAKTVRRSYIDEELGLAIDTTPFDRVFYGQVPQLAFSPYEAHTPWLNEALDEMVRMHNSKLEAHYINSREKLRESFIELASSSIHDIMAAVDPQNETTRYHRLAQAAQRDYQYLRENSDEKVTKSKQALREDYEERRQEYVRSRFSELEREFDRKYRADFDYQLSQVEPGELMIAERVHATALATINNSRRQEAQMRYVLSLDQIVESMRPELHELLEREEEIMREAVEDIKEYVNDKAKDDLVQAQAINDKLERDNRVEEIRRESELQIEQYQRQADERVAEIEEHMATLRREHEKVMAESERDNRGRVERADQRVEDMLKEKESAERRAQRLIEQAEAERDDVKAQAIEDVEQARLNSEAFMDSQRENNTTLIIAVIVLSVVMLVAGVLLGNFLL